MARRHSRRRSRRHSRRRVRRNRGLVRNIFGADLTRDVLVPIAGGAAGFFATRALGHALAQHVPQLNGNVKLGKLIAAGVAIPAAFTYAGVVRQVGLGPGAVVLGLGVSAAEAYLRDTPLLGGGRAAAAITEPAPPAPEPDGVGSYYNSGMLGQTMYAAAGLGRGYDVSHYGAPYAGMLGFGDDEDPADQAAVDRKHDLMEAVSTITPTDAALPAAEAAMIRPVDHPFAGRQGYAGGVFARHLFSGMYGA